MATKNLLIRGGADFSNVKKELDKTQKKLNSFKSGISKTMSKIKFALGALALGSLVKDSTKMAMSVESSMDNINRTMQGSSKVFGEWIKAQSQAFGMSRAEAYKYGSTYSNLISSFETSTSKIADNTQELMKATGIIASKTGRTYEDTAERIRSGMLGSTEAIEDLGVYTQVSMLESTNAFKEFANGKSWQQLNFQTQQQIRLAAILEQTYSRYGTTLADTTQTRQNQFIASLKNVQLTLGQAFLPIYNAVLPPLTFLMNTLGKAISIIAQFTTALFGKPKGVQSQAKAISSQAASVGDLGTGLDNAGDSAKKTEKALKGTVAGFDEINSLSQDSGSSSGSSGGAAEVGGIENPLESLDMSEGGFLSSVAEVSEKVQEMANKVKGFFGEVKEFIVGNKDIIISAISGILAGFATFTIINNYKKIIDTVSIAFKALGVAISGISIPILAISALIALLVGSLVYLWRTDKEFRDKVTETWKGIKETVTLVWEKCLKPICQYIGAALLSIWQYALKPLLASFIEFVKQVTILFMDIWNKVFKPFVDWFVKYLGPVIAVVFNTLLATITLVIVGVINVLRKLIDFITWLVKAIINTIDPLITFIKSVFVAAWTFAVSAVTNGLTVFKNTIVSIFNNIKGILNGIITFVKGVFTGNWKMAFQGLSDIVKNVFGGMVNIVKHPINAIIGYINALIDGLNQLKFDIPSWVPGSLGGKSFGINIPKIPLLAKGGVIDSPTLAMVGEAGREAVVPLENNTGWKDEIGSMVANAVLSAMQFNGGGANNSSEEIILKLDGMTLARAVKPHLNKEDKRIGKSMILRTT